ncbi:hypothetical protein W5A_05293 [Imtechella halotolerans K1]|uniref:Serine aminopeptidase S33 domain-containing protein n=2 Tax=Imtechella TaxID=1165076 RepID=I0WGT7_9FLAO|nr:hypothetical protein W5A_05293 [Imtechella halotolerans K1]
MKFNFLLSCLFISLFTYSQIIEEKVVLYNDSIVLPGTLTIPSTTSEPPVAIFIHGSGNVDRNGNQAGVNINANYIKQLSDSLNKYGIAFYRYDKRTATAKNSKYMTSNVTINNFVKDAQIAIEHFKNDPRFSDIVVIGHSQGSLIAMLALSEDVTKFVSISGPSMSIEETLIQQLNTQATALGDKAREHFTELMTTDTIQKVHPFLMNIFAPVNQKFLKSWNQYVPAQLIHEIKTQKILIVNGDSDSQVSPEEARILHQVKPEATLAIIPKMNHVLKEINSFQENINSYHKDTYPLSSKLIEALVEFIIK